MSSFNFTDHANDDPDLQIQCDGRYINGTKMISLSCVLASLSCIIFFMFAFGPFPVEDGYNITTCIVALSCISICCCCLFSIYADNDTKIKADETGEEYKPKWTGATGGVTSAMGLFEYGVISITFTVLIIAAMHLYKSANDRDGSTISRVQRGVHMTRNKYGNRYDSSADGADGDDGDEL